MSTDVFPNTQLYPFGYCAIFAKRLTPSGLLARAAGTDVRYVELSRTEAEIILAQGEDTDEDDLPDLDFDALNEAGLFDNNGPLLRAGTHGDWSYVIEPYGSYLAGDDVLKAVSQDTAALQVRQNETGSCWISYAENADILSSFDPLFPDHDYGSRPEILEQLTGHRQAISAGQRADAFTNAVHKIQQELHCTIPPETDAGRLPAARVAEEH